MEVVEDVVGQGSVEVVRDREPTAVEAEASPTRTGDRHEPSHGRGATADDHVLARLGPTEEVGEVRLRFMHTDGGHEIIVAEPTDT